MMALCRDYDEFRREFLPWLYASKDKLGNEVIFLSLAAALADMRETLGEELLRELIHKIADDLPGIVALAQLREDEFHAI